MPTSNTPEILQLIQQDHEEVQGLFEQFHKSMSAKDGEEKADPISKQILDNLKLHTELEEKIVYPSLKDQYPKIFYESRKPSQNSLFKAATYMWAVTAIGILGLVPGRTSRS